MNARRFDAIFFDAGNTLFTERRTRDELYCDVFAEFGIEVGVDRMATWREDEHDAMPERVDEQPRYSEAWFRVFVTRLLRRADVEHDAEPLRIALAERFVHAAAYRVFDDVPAALDALRGRGQRLAVVSNWSDHLDGILAGLGLRTHFEAVFASAVVGISKPAPALFSHAVEALGLEPARVLHIGDRHDNDIVPARPAGLSAWRIDRTRGSSQERDVIPDLNHLVARISD